MTPTMKIEIDTNAKTIRLGESVTIQELIAAMERWFPDEDWKTFSVQGGSAIVFTNGNSGTANLGYHSFTTTSSQ